jgi:formylglycine-generating enzyme required for sulfatase activity
VASFDQLSQEYNDFVESNYLLPEKERIDEARRLLNLLRQAGRHLEDPLKREVVSVWARSVGEAIYEISGEYPAVRISPFETLQHVEGITASGPNPDREYYLRKVIEKLGYLSLSRVTSMKTGIPLQTVYASLPTDLVFSVKVENREIVDWWASQSSLKRERIDTNSALFENKATVDDKAISLLRDEMQKAVDTGVGYGYGPVEARPLILAPLWYDGIREDFWTVKAENAAALFDRLVILGPPGSGKSTFARYLALCLAYSQLESSSPQTRIQELGVWPHGALTPIFVELRRFVGWEGFPKLGNSVTSDHFLEYVSRELLADDMREFRSELHQDLVKGQAVIIFDGLDEIPIPAEKNSLEQRREQMQELTQSLGVLYPRCRIVVTSREHGYDDWHLRNFSVVRLAPLSDDQIKNLAVKLYRQVGSGDAEAQATSLLEALNIVPSVLGSNPLLLTLLAVLFQARGELSLTKGHLYEQIIKLFIERWTQPRLGDRSLVDQLGCTAVDLYSVLRIIAYKNCATSSSEIPLALLLTELFKLGPTVNIHDAVAFLSQQSGVLVSPGVGQYRFAHRAFQEYLAASYMANSSDFSLVRASIERQPYVWREPCLMVEDVLLASGRRSEAWELLSVLLDDELPEDLAANDSRVWSIWLAGHIALTLNLRSDSSDRRNILIFQSLRDWLKFVLTVPTDLPARERVDIGDVLGEIGDNRPGVGIQRDGLPDICWCEIPSGEFQLGLNQAQIDKIRSEEWARGWEFARETPASTVLVPAFAVSLYPVTQIQFWSFVDDGGYEDRQWWTQAGWAWLQKMGFDGPAGTECKDRPNYPCTNVSWYEAVAFCNWLSEKISCTIRLPTEVEWEKAARGTDGRSFQWGNSFDASKCNNAATGIERVCAVGCFPLNNGAWAENSPLDMCGNVWEWCTTISEKADEFLLPYPYDKGDGRENLDLGDEYLRVVRGGSFLNPPFLTRTTFRGRDKPFSRFARQGFRVVRELGS